MKFRRRHTCALACLLLGTRLGFAAPPAPALVEARTLADELADPETQPELRLELATTLARAGYSTEARTIAETLPPGHRAMALLEIAAHLPASRRAEAEQLTLDAQTAKALTRDWRKARVARLLAVAHARLDHFEAAEALAQTVPDTEDKAFALQEVVQELCRAGLVERARTLAGTIEENRRYGTYRQKAAALAACARTLRARGNPDDATTLLAQAELLLPKKPGWSDGVAFVAVGEAAYGCAQKEKARELLTRADELAQTIAGPWKVSELSRTATAWQQCGDDQRASDCLTTAGKFLATLQPLERAEESSSLARAWVTVGQPAKGRATLRAAFDEIDRAVNKNAWRKARMHTLLAWTELFGDEALATKVK